MQSIINKFIHFGLIITAIFSLYPLSAISSTTPISAFSVANFVNHSFSLAFNDQCIVAKLGSVPPDSISFAFTPRDLEPYCTHTLAACSIEIHPSVDCSGATIAKISIGLDGIHAIQNTGTPGYQVSYQSGGDIQVIMIGTSSHNYR